MESVDGFQSANVLYRKQSGEVGQDPPREESANMARRRERTELPPEAEADKEALHDVDAMLNKVRADRERRDRTIEELKEVVKEPQEVPKAPIEERSIPKAFLAQRQVLAVPVEHKAEVLKVPAVPAHFIPLTPDPQEKEQVRAQIRARVEELSKAEPPVITDAHVKELAEESAGGQEGRSKRAKCESCGYVWNIRTKRTPKACPRCKSRLDYGGANEAERVRVQKAIRVLIRDLRRPRKGLNDLRQADPDYPSPELLIDVLKAYLDAI